jgi:hypothetical protein
MKIYLVDEITIAKNKRICERLITERAHDPREAALWRGYLSALEDIERGALSMGTEER